MSAETVQLWICESCGFIYDPAEGDPDGGIPPGTAFTDIPEDWYCPVCGARKMDFVPYEDWRRGRLRRGRTRRAVASAIAPAGDADEPGQLVLGDRQRRHQHDDVAERPHDRAAPARGERHPMAHPLGRRERRQLDPRHEPAPPHLGDGGQRRDELVE